MYRASLTLMIICGVGDKLYLPVATLIADLIKKTVYTMEAEYEPKTLEEVGIKLPGLMWVCVHCCSKNTLSLIALSYTGKFHLVHLV